MKPFIFAARNGIYIIDLYKTMRSIKEACEIARSVSAGGGKVLFVGTKKQAKDAVKAAAMDCGMFYVTERWLGGMLTNFQTIRQNIRRLKDIERMAGDGTYAKLTKKEVLGLERERAKLEKVIGGIKEMGGLPNLMIVVDSKKERIAVAEANKLGIPVIGIIDTNSDPDCIDYPIAANDDAIRSISVIIGELTEAIKAGQTRATVEEMKESGEPVPEGEDSGTVQVQSAEESAAENV